MLLSLLLTAFGDESKDPQSFFTLQSIGTFATASTAVLVITNTFRRLAPGIKVLWVAAVSSLLLSTTSAFIANTFDHPTGRSIALGCFLILLNGCLLFSTAAGLNEGVAAPGKGGGGALESLNTRPTWRGTWF